MGNRFFQFPFRLLLGFLFIVTNEYNWVVAAARFQCVDSEQKALLMFKEGFQSPSAHFTSWVAEEDCCKWKGIECNNITGHVTTLDLHSPNSVELLQGQLSESLLDLPYLSYLDLSQNDFCQNQIPEFLGSLSNLKYLNLSNANFRGTIPNHLGNLSSLQSLDLGEHRFSLRINNIDWLSGLSSLEVLDLGGVDLSNVFNWLDAINMLPSLVELNLFSCQLHILPQSLPSVNFTSLGALDLSYNQFSSKIPKWLFDISHSLTYLNLTRCQLQGSISNAFVNFTSLMVLDFSYNYLNGSIPQNLGNMTSLAIIDLSFNDLGGPIPTTLGLGQELDHYKHSPLRELCLSYNMLNGSFEQILPQLSELVVLEAASNRLKGSINEAHLQNFSSLQALDLNGNELILNISSNWTPPFQLETIGLGHCKMGPKFPQWLQSQKKILKIDLSSAHISDTMPSWFWDLSSPIEHLYLSYNLLRGELPNLSSRASLLTLDLSDNEFWGHLPPLPPKIESLVLSGNAFSGTISPLCDVMNESNAVAYLDLSKNHLSGQLPDCWTYAQNLLSLDLRANNFSGELPSSFKNFKNLLYLYLGGNALSGIIPAWLGESLEKLQVLSLSSNLYEGNIPWQLCQLKYITKIDLSFNSISGRIPRCINNFLVMARREADCTYCYYVHASYATEQTKTRMWLGSYTDGYEYPMVMDFSSNKLTGEIPIEITELIGLADLNLSNNHLAGSIPCNIGAMKTLYSLDLSRNQLSHNIPPSISDLTDLESLDFSYNNLSGKVPSFNSSSHFRHGAKSYVGNPKLCGPPLPNDCSENESFDDAECSSNKKSESQNHGIQKEEEHKEDGFVEMPSFYVSIAVGFVTGFLGFWTFLALSESWRHAYFHFLGNMGDKINVFVVVTMARLQREFQREQAAE